MIVRLFWRRRGKNAQAAGHAHVHDQRIAAEAKQQVLAPAVDPIDDATDQPPWQIARNRPAEPAVVHPHGRHFLPFYVRSDAAPRRFNLGKLGHGWTGARLFVAAPTIPHESPAPATHTCFMPLEAL